MISGLIVKANVDAADVVFDVSADPNTSDMLSLARICPLEKRVSATVLYNPVETGRAVAQVLLQRGGKVLYITGNNIKVLSGFEITENEVEKWLSEVLGVMLDRGVVIDMLLTDDESGVGVAAARAAATLGIQVGEKLTA